MRALSTFAGCTPREKALVLAQGCLYYICTCNVVRADADGAAEIFSLGSHVSCIAAGHGCVLVGCTDGTSHTIMDGKMVQHTKMESCIQACCAQSSTCYIFCTLDTILVTDAVHGRLARCSTDYIISCLETMDGLIFVGSTTGKLYIYSCLGESIQLAEVVEAHPERIKCVKTMGARCIATASQDANIKLWVCGDTLRHVQTLNGHSDWVNHLEWDGAALYSASSDRTIRIWTKNSVSEKQDGKAEDTCFTNTDIIGGTSEFLGMCCWNGALLGQCRTGGVDRYVEQGGHYRCQYFISGHTNEVCDLDWRQNMLLSCSMDSTTRIFYKGVEVGRPQIHGYAISSAKFLPNDRMRIVSAAQETILRILEATHTFFKRCMEADDRQNCGDDSGANLLSRNWAGCIDEYAPDAVLAELNLTNEVTDELSPLPLSEGALAASVFREVEKIYGHFFDLKSIAVTEKLVFSCNKSQSKHFAGLFVWDLNGKKLDYITDHSLGIQRIKATRDYVLTASRDKTACLYKITGTKLSLLKQFADHTRAVWDCGVAADSSVFATCSRDCRVILYSMESLGATESREFACEVTAIDFSPVTSQLAVGLLDGSIRLLDFALRDVAGLRAAGKAVTVVKYNDDGSRLAVGGCDGVIRVVEIN